MEVIASRDFNQLFIYLDILFLVGLAGLLFYTKRYMTIIFGLLGGVIKPLTGTESKTAKL